jgi:hypothetical protein
MFALAKPFHFQLYKNNLSQAFQSHKPLSVGDFFMPHRLHFLPQVSNIEKVAPNRNRLCQNCLA